jgi:hypothetical protein
MKSFFTLIILVMFGFTGCNQPEPKISSSTPSWILNPNQNGKIGAIGSAGMVYDGKTSTKRKLAITRALDELSLQQGVKVQLSMTKTEQLSNDRTSVNMNANSSYKSNETITAHIEAVWENPKNKELFIWMVMD